MPLRARRWFVLCSDTAQACNALLLKVNQIGSVTESIKACTMAQNAGWVSSEACFWVLHRCAHMTRTGCDGVAPQVSAALVQAFISLIRGSGETEDSFIADLVVGLRAGQIKVRWQGHVLLLAS